MASKVPDPTQPGAAGAWVAAPVGGVKTPQPPGIRRSMFGLRSADVQRFLAERERVAVEARDRIRASEERIASLERRLAAMTQDRVRLEEELASQSASPRAPETAAVSLDAIGAETARVLQETQEACARVLERTRASLDAQVEDAERRVQAAAAEREHLSAWSTTFGDALQRLGGRLAETRGTLTQVRRALDQIAPVEDAMGRLEGELQDLSRLLDRFRSVAVVSDGTTSSSGPQVDQQMASTRPPGTPRPPATATFESPPRDQ
jgi:DNA repair exonuclease SbcCD ATPase subunit